MSNTPFQPVRGIIKKEPFSIFSAIDEKPLIDPMNSTFVSNRENSQLQPGSSIGTTQVEDIEYCTISGKKPYFNLILAKSHVSRPYQVFVPTKFLSGLPSALVPMVLASRGKKWNTFYHGDSSAKRFIWKRFVIDNDLKIGDCCFFELKECTTAKLEFKVIILRGSLPFGLEAGKGDTPETPIVIE
ncbi:hypothetical protein ACH5RR_039230 [Cinchona calisaya]|uniref:TF-B3 domain-containing protein n=1 Tax=Cinchona calisaya TaxID=153742 RepID=A0ABD2Y135_9GENT